jgi:hypothetical protein
MSKSKAESRFEHFPTERNERRLRDYHKSRNLLRDVNPELYRLEIKPSKINKDYVPLED